MQPIRTFSDLITHLQQQQRQYSLAVVGGSDNSTIEAVMRAVSRGFVRATFVGHTQQVRAHTLVKAYTGSKVTYVNAETDEEAAALAVRMVHDGEANVLMKGLVHTDTLLRAVLHKEWGILPKGNVLTHIAAAQIPTYEQLLFFTDAAVIPYPTPEQRAAQISYLAHLLHTIGIAQPRIALIHCTESASEKFPHTMSYANLCQRASRGEWGNTIVDGPLDLRTACDPVALAVKGITSPLQGRADALVLPDIESGNVLYKVLSLFAGAKLAGCLQGTKAPVVLTSRGDNTESKFHSLAFATLAVQ